MAVDYTEPCKIFVGGLNRDTSNESLKNHFSKFGEVEKANVMFKDNGESRGFGFVLFKQQDSVQKVIQEKQDQILDGKKIDPKPAKQKGAQKINRIFVGGVPETTDKEMIALFSQAFGKAVSVDMKIDATTKRPRGFLFVDFEDSTSVEKAVKQHFIDYHGSKMEIKPAESRDKQSKPAQQHPPQQQQFVQTAHCGGYSTFPDYSNLYQPHSNQQQAYYSSGQYQNYPSYYGSGYTQAEQSYGTSGNQQVGASAQSQQHVPFQNPSAPNQHIPFQNPSAQNQHVPFRNPSAQSQHMPFQNPHSYAANNGRAAPGGYSNTAGSASDGYNTSYNYPHDARQTTVASGSQFSSYDHTAAPSSYSHMGGHSTAQL